MRSWKVAFAAIAVAVIVIAFLVLRRGDALIGGTAGAATPNPATIAMPVPVTKIVKKAVPIYLDYSARTESIRNIALQAKVSGYIRQQHVPDGTDVKESELLYTIDPRDFQAALDQAKAQAQRDAAALDYAHSNLDRGSTLAKSGILAKDTFDQRASAAQQAEAALAMDQAAVRTAELNLRHPRAVRRTSRSEPGSCRRPYQRRRRAIEHAGATRSDLRHIQPERDGPGRDPEGARRREGRSGHPPAGRDAGASRRRADFHRQCGRSLNWHHRRARDHRQR